MPTGALAYGGSYEEEFADVVSTEDRRVVFGRAFGELVAVNGSCETDAISIYGPGVIGAWVRRSATAISPSLSAVRCRTDQKHAEPGIRWGVVRPIVRTRASTRVSRPTGAFGALKCQGRYGRD